MVCLQLLADHPGLGRSAGRVRGTLRRHEHGAHVILYRPEGTDIIVLAVFHMSSNWQIPATDD
jgi:toxin ParE1/3/4